MACGSGRGIYHLIIMSIISSLAELFRRSAVPSIESTLIQGGTRERAISNLKALVGEGTTISQQAIGTAIARIQTALQRGAAIERGESVARQFIPVDPTIPIGTEYRYRIRVTAEIPDPLNRGGVQTIDKVIPIDSESQMTREQLRSLGMDAIANMMRTVGSPNLERFIRNISTQEVLNQRIEIISVYRSPIG